MNKTISDDVNDVLDMTALEQVSGGFCATPPGVGPGPWPLPTWPTLPLPIPAPRPPVDPVPPSFPPVFPPPTIRKS